MDNGLVTSDVTTVLKVAEYDRFVNFIPIKFRPIFELNTITGLWYVELQRLRDDPTFTVFLEDQHFF